MQYLQTRVHIQYYFLSIMLSNLTLQVLSVFSFTLEHAMLVLKGDLIYGLDFFVHL